MADTVNVTIRLDRNLKASAERAFEDMGMNLSTAITVFLKQAVLKGRIPFRIEADPFWSKENQAQLEESRKAAEAGKLTEHALIEVE